MPSACGEASRSGGRGRGPAQVESGSQSSRLAENRLSFLEGWATSYLPHPKASLLAHGWLIDGPIAIRREAKPSRVLSVPSTECAGYWVVPGTGLWSLRGTRRLSWWQVQQRLLPSAFPSFVIDSLSSFIRKSPFLRARWPSALSVCRESDCQNLSRRWLKKRPGPSVPVEGLPVTEE